VGRSVNQTELAEVFGVSDVTLWEWQKAGMPIVKVGERGTANEYDTEAVIKWYTAREVRKVSNETQRDRQARLTADMLELDLAERNRTLVPVEQIEPVWQARIFAAAAFLGSQPSRLAGMLEGAPGIEAKRDILRKEFNTFLMKLGVDGERMQEEVGRLLEKVSAQDAAELLARLTKGHDNQPDSSGSAAPGLAGARPETEDPAVGVG
jgi:phage terminase Nu1 subunit (DNA packaging protein)